MLQCPIAYAPTEYVPYSGNVAKILKLNTIILFCGSRSSEHFLTPTRVSEYPGKSKKRLSK